MENIPVFIAIAVGVAGFGTMCVVFLDLAARWLAKGGGTNV
jgi:hypothetical protein